MLSAFALCLSVVSVFRLFWLWIARGLGAVLRVVWVWFCVDWVSFGFGLRVVWAWIARGSGVDCEWIGCGLFVVRMWFGQSKNGKKIDTLLDLCVSSLRRGHANLLCIVPILTDDLRRESDIGCAFNHLDTIVAGRASAFLSLWQGDCLARSTCMLHVTCE